MTDTDARKHPALTDSQTGLPNRLHWETVYGIIFAAGDRGIPLTLMMVEVDDYESWPGWHNPEEANRAMLATAQALASTTRQTDLVSRIDEYRFAFLLLDCNLPGGHLVADRIDSLLDPVREQTGLGFSIGVAAYNRDMLNPQDLVDAATGALKEAQERGGNQIEFAR